jgi:branched-chain amino acid transport system permease protein
MNRLRQIPRDYFVLAVVVPVLAFLPVVLKFDRFQMSLAIVIVYWAFLGMAWNIMAGYAGQFSFGHAAFYGIGAYSSTVLLLDYRISPWVGMLVGAVLAGLFGLVMGYVSFRYGLKGPYFALATFAFAEMLRLVSSELEFINTSIGITLPLIRGDSWIALQFEQTPGNYYYAILIIFTIGMLVNILVAHSKLGYYLQAIREDEDAASALGVNLLRYKTIAVVISGALTAMGGSFFTQYFLFVSPELAFGVPISVEILLRPMVGGIGTIWGPLIGAIFLTPLGEFTRAFVRTPPPFLSFIEGRSGVDVMIFGALLIIVIIFMPDGIVGAGQRLWERIRKSS